MHCTSCGQDTHPRIDIRQQGPVDAITGTATGMARMYVCDNAECNAVLGPYDPPALPKAAEVIQLSPAELTESVGNAAMLLGQPAPTPPVVPPIMTGGPAALPPEPGPVHATFTPVQPPTADEIENDARRRLEFVRAEIAKLRGYEDEEQRLELMLSALAPASQERATTA